MIRYTLLLSLASLILTEALLRIPLAKIGHEKKYLDSIKAASYSMDTGLQGDASSLTSEYTEFLKEYMNSKFYGNMSAGVPAQTFKVLIDTTKSSLWVTCAGCNDKNVACIKHNKFVCAESLTCSDTNVSVTVTENIEASYGVIYNDVLCFGNDGPFCTDETQAFACVMEPKKSQAITPFDGTLGLSWSSQQNWLNHPFDQFFQDTDTCPDSIFSIFIISNNNGSSISGEMTLCGIDYEQITGEIWWTNVKYTDTWIISVASVHYGNTIIDSNAEAVVDSGSYHITGPAAYVNDLETAAGNLEIVTNMISLVDCDKLKTLKNFTLNIGGKTFELTPDEYIIKVHFNAVKLCIYGFIGLEFESNVGPKWMLGELFSRKYSATFDRGNKRVGFATIK